MYLSKNYTTNHISAKKKSGVFIHRDKIKKQSWGYSSKQLWAIL